MQIIFAVLFCVSLGMASIEPPPANSLTLDARCIRVIDGDTLVCESTVRYQIRIIGCWSPESRTKNLAEKKRGLKSKARMIELAEGRQLRVSIPLTGDLTDSTTLGRFLGHVWLEDGRDLGEMMVREGLATKTKLTPERK